MDKIILDGIAEISYADGICHVVINESIELSPAMLESIHAAGLAASGGAFHCMLADISRNVSSTPEARKYAAHNPYMSKHIAYAMVGTQLSVTLLANFFIRFNRPLVNTRLFSSETAAREWLLKKVNEFHASGRKTE